VIEAAEEAQRYVIGVDSDQYAVYRASHPEQARFIATSVMKDVDVALERAIGAHIEQRLRYGSVDSIGLKEGGISLARGSEVLRNAPAALLAELDMVRQRIVAGSIVVPSAFVATKP
jgi:basic membrane protein A